MALDVCFIWGHTRLFSSLPNFSDIWSQLDLLSDDMSHDFYYYWLCDVLVYRWWNLLMSILKKNIVAILLGRGWSGLISLSFFPIYINLGSTPSLRTLQRSPIMGKRSVYTEEKKIQFGVQTRSSWAGSASWCWLCPDRTRVGCQR